MALYLFNSLWARNNVVVVEDLRKVRSKFSLRYANWESNKFGTVFFIFSVPINFKKLVESG